MREYTTYPKENEIIEVKKPKLYIVTSKIVNLLAIFVASISVSTFFATRYIGISDTFFSANAFSTMLAMALFIVILENYGKKNAMKAFMAGAYAILLIFFISAFIPDFNPLPVGYDESSLINFHQKILLSVFISYVISFLVCIKIYLYMKNELNIPYLWVKAAPAIIISQLFYTVCYYLIYHGFNNLEYASTDIKNELYLKFFMLVVDILVIYFIISGIKSGFFDLTKNIFSYNSQNNHYDESEYSPHPIKNITEDYNRRAEDLPNLYLNDYRKKRSKRYLPDYSEESYDSRKNSRGSFNDYYKNEVPKENEYEYNRREIEEFNSKNIGKETPMNSRKSSRRRSLSRREVEINRNERVNLDHNNENNIIRNRGNHNKLLGQNDFSNQQLHSDYIKNNFQSISSNKGLNYFNPQLGRSSFGGNLGGRTTPQSSQSFFVNTLTPNKMNTNFNGIHNSNFGNIMNRHNNWNKR